MFNSTLGEQDKVNFSRIHFISAMALLVGVNLTGGCQEAGFFNTRKQQKPQDILSPEERDRAGQRGPDFGGTGDQQNPATNSPLGSTSPTANGRPGNEPLPGSNQSNGTNDGFANGPNGGGSNFGSSTEGGTNYAGGNGGGDSRTGGSDSSSSAANSLPSEPFPPNDYSGGGGNTISGGSGPSGTNSTSNPTENFPPPLPGTGGSSNGGSSSVSNSNMTDPTYPGSSGGDFNGGDSSSSGNSVFNPPQDPGNPTEGFPPGGSGSSGGDSSTGGSSSGGYSTGGFASGGDSSSTQPPLPSNPTEGFPPGSGSSGGDSNTGGSGSFGDSSGNWNSSNLGGGNGGEGASSGSGGSSDPREGFPPATNGGNGNSGTNQGQSGGDGNFTGGNSGKNSGRGDPPQGKEWLELTLIQAAHESWWKNCIAARVEGEEDWQFAGCNKDPGAVGRTIQLMASAWPACNKVQILVETYQNQGPVCHIRMQSGLPCEGPYREPPHFNYARSTASLPDQDFMRLYNWQTVLNPDPLIQSNAGWVFPDVQRLSAEMREFAGDSNRNKWIRGFFEDQPRANLEAVRKHPDQWKQRGIDYNDFVFDVKGRNVNFFVEGSGLRCEE